MAALYQPFFKREASQSAERKRLATIVTPRWGFVLQLVLRGVEANKVRASIFAKLENKNIFLPLRVLKLA